ncbi:HNH endonuclease signature motif containing protein [Mycobacterium sp. IDR2000157661]|uniref:HNH endonuclease signature motif containing protein n=1 Tax=Mycobacterium sp. IDR2000157661 TaxID=2867005 RepID=UPI001EEE46A5|nr:HNH endonuclease signature motif containing protein [Mycobacterium sp. IDR2000157661]ULE34922.1 HNH endonuclease [Mycobacterium sp. IDR2000157661]
MSLVPGSEVEAAVARLRAARDGLMDLRLEAADVGELLGLLDTLESDRRRAPALEHQILGELSRRVAPADIGAKNWSEVLQRRLRIGVSDARRRLDEAKDLGPRRTMTGEALEPPLPNVAKRQAAGELGADHVRVIRKFFRELPVAVDYQTREGCEETLAQLAAEHTPDVLRQAADRLAALVNPDGVFDDVDRARRRHFTIGKQEADGMSPVRGLLDPEARATLDAVLGKWAAPGMCNPDDEAPCVDGEPSEVHVRADQRTQSQRNHDALKAMGRSVLSSGELGKHRGLPVTIIVSTTLQDLESAAGIAVTGGGTTLPMSDVIRLARHAHHYLAIFDKHTQEPLYLGRTKRLASAGQRIVLHSRDRGCTAPGCTVPGYGSEVHHAVLDWVDGGLTNITDEVLACPPHNRLVTEGGWTTRKRKDGRIEWIPPPLLDTGQARVNNYHHPQRYLLPDDDDGRTNEESGGGGI